MKTSILLTILAALGTSSVKALPFEDTAILERAAGNLPGLTTLQTAHANQIIGQIKEEGLGQQGCKAAIITGLTESSLRILTNGAVLASTRYPHDGLGSDHDNIGIFQQRAEYYNDIACDMDAACSAGQFLSIMKGIHGWQTMDVATLC